VTGELAVRGEDAFGVPGVTSTATELRFPPNLPYESWERIGKALGAGSSAFQFWLGDWHNFGEAQYRKGETYQQALEATGRSLGGLYNVASVARRVPASVRRTDLSWSHHREVAALGRAKQIEWLARAAANTWSVNMLHDTLREAGELTTVVRSERSGERAVEPVESLRDVARNIANLALPNDRGEVCVPAELLRRLRVALGEAVE
jgi:hypothetical protein